MHNSAHLSEVGLVAAFQPVLDLKLAATEPLEVCKSWRSSRVHVEIFLVRQASKGPKPRENKLDKSLFIDYKIVQEPNGT